MPIWGPDRTPIDRRFPARPAFYKNWSNNWLRERIGVRATSMPRASPLARRRPPLRKSAEVERDLPRLVLGHAAGLLFPVFLCVSLYCLFSVPSRMNDVSPCCVSMVRRLLMKAALVMFSRFSVMASGVRKMFGCFLVVFRCFLRHRIFSLVCFIDRFDNSQQRTLKLRHLASSILYRSAH